MSRFAFGSIFTTTDDLEIEDQKGYGFFEWEAHGVVGYDEGLATYFANLEGSWGIGTEYQELPTIADLQRRLVEAFQGAELPFNRVGLERLAQGVEDSPTILASSQAASKKS
jgi:hypothetical protein